MISIEIGNICACWILANYQARFSVKTTISLIEQNINSRIRSMLGSLPIDNQVHTTVFVHVRVKDLFFSDGGGLIRPSRAGAS